MTTLAVVRTAEGLDAFGGDPVWVVILKAVAIFVLLLLLTRN